MIAPLLAASAFALVLGTGVLWFLRIRNVRIPTDRTPFVVAAIAGVVLGAAALSLGEGALPGVAAVMAMLGGLLFCFTVAISRQKVGGDVIRVGARLPAFQATDEEGVVFDSAELAGRPVLLKFFRGHW